MIPVMTYCPPVRCWRLLHKDGEVVRLEDKAAACSTGLSLFASANKQECLDKITELGLTLPEGKTLADLTVNYVPPA